MISNFPQKFRGFYSKFHFEIVKLAIVFATTSFLTRLRDSYVVTTYLDTNFFSHFWKCNASAVCENFAEKIFSSCAHVLDIRCPFFERKIPWRFDRNFPLRKFFDDGSRTWTGFCLTRKINVFHLISPRAPQKMWKNVS